MTPKPIALATYRWMRDGVRRRWPEATPEQVASAVLEYIGKIREFDRQERRQSRGIDR